MAIGRREAQMEPLNNSSGNVISFRKPQYLVPLDGKIFTNRAPVFQPRNY
jgi:hypothetical protein